MRKVALSGIMDHLCEYLHLAGKEEIVIIRHGKSPGLLVGFASEDDWFVHRLENDPRFWAGIAAARRSLKKRERHQG